jgi:hypothetical protein
MPALPALIVGRGGFDGPSALPRAVFTGTGSDPRPRIRVDQAQTSFYENREFRAYHEFSIAPGASVWLRWTMPTDVLIHGRDVIITAGAIRYALYDAGTPSGIWTPKPMYRVNNLASAPVYLKQTTVDVGGALAGGVEIDTMSANSGTGGNSSTASVGVIEGGLAAGVYYVELRSVGAQACSGVYRVNFEEYQPVASAIIFP